jgi:hypothetical protein
MSSTTLPSAECLRAQLKVLYPTNATCWSQATDEVRDLCRHARELLDLPEEDAIDFRVLNSPFAWNTIGINGIISFYKRMNDEQKLYFVTNYNHLWTAE